MSQYDPQKMNYLKPLPPEVQFQPATAKQENYIQILTNDLGYTENQRDIQITTLLKRRFSWFNDKLSKGEASYIINEFKKWKQAKQ